jgi:hypothetical protein
MRNAYYTRSNGCDVAFLTQHFIPPPSSDKNWADVLSYHKNGPKSTFQLEIPCGFATGFPYPLSLIGEGWGEVK